MDYKLIIDNKINNIFFLTTNWKLVYEVRYTILNLPWKIYYRIKYIFNLK